MSTHRNNLNQRAVDAAADELFYRDYEAELRSKGLTTPAEKIGKLADRLGDEAEFWRGRANGSS